MELSPPQGPAGCGAPSSILVLVREHQLLFALFYFLIQGFFPFCPLFSCGRLYTPSLTHSSSSGWAPCPRSRSWIALGGEYLQCLEPRFCICWAGDTPATWFWWPRWACFSGSLRLATDGKTVLGRLPPQGTVQAANWNSSPDFLWGRPTCSAWSVDLRRKLPYRHTIRGPESASQVSQRRGLWAPSLFSLCLPTACWHLFEGGLYTPLSGALWRHLPDGRTQMARGAYAWGAHRTVYIFAYFKSCYPRVWISISLSRGAWI